MSCRGTGYRGRTVIAELLLLNGSLRQQILAHADAAQLRMAAIKAGMQTLYENGLARALDGITSYEEVLRVAQDLEGGQ